MFRELRVSPASAGPTLMGWKPRILSGVPKKNLSLSSVRCRPGASVDAAAAAGTAGAGPRFESESDDDDEEELEREPNSAENGRMMPLIADTPSDCATGRQAIEHLKHASEA